MEELAVWDSSVKIGQDTPCNVTRGLAAGPLVPFLMSACFYGFKISILLLENLSVDQEFFRWSACGEE